MNLLIWINAAFGVLATAFGLVVVHGVLRGSLRRKWPTRFLECSLVASLSGLLPFARHLAPMQDICMLSVYCSAAAVAAWLKFHLLGLWRPVFALSVTAVLYLDLVSGSIQLFTVAHTFNRPFEEPAWVFHALQFGLASVFAALGAMAMKKCYAEPTRLS